MDLFIYAGNVVSARGKSMYRYWDQELCGGTRAHKLNKVGSGTRAQSAQGVLAGWWFE